MGEVHINKGRVGEDRGSKETDGCPLTVWGRRKHWLGRLSGGLQRQVMMQFNGGVASAALAWEATPPACPPQEVVGD
jgi:hypothetical protein